MDGARKDASILSESRVSQMESHIESAVGVMPTGLPYVVEDAQSARAETSRARAGSRDYVLRRLLACADSVSLLIALAVAVIWVSGVTETSQHLLLGALTV